MNTLDELHFVSEELKAQGLSEKVISVKSYPSVNEVEVLLADGTRIYRGTDAKYHLEKVFLDAAKAYIETPSPVMAAADAVVKDVIQTNEEEHSTTTPPGE